TPVKSLEEHPITSNPSKNCWTGDFLLNLLSQSLFIHTGPRMDRNIDIHSALYLSSPTAAGEIIRTRTVPSEQRVGQTVPVLEGGRVKPEPGDPCGAMGDPIPG